MAKGFPDCLNLHDGDVGDPRNVHRAQQIAGLIGQNPTVIKGVAANAECSTQAEYTSRVVTRVGGTERVMTRYILVDLHTAGSFHQIEASGFAYLPAGQSNPS